jgi:hypothetical protein
MAQTYVNGTDLRFYLGGVAIGGATSCSMELSVETREALTKDDVGGWATFEVGRKSGTMTAEGLMSNDTPNFLVSQLFTALKDGTILEIAFTDETPGNASWEASVICTGLNVSAPVEENTTYSATFTIRGEPSLGA